jgi:sigma-70-like protein
MFEPLRQGMNGMQGKRWPPGGDGGMARQPRPAAEIGKRLGISQTHVSPLLAEALSKPRERLVSPT